MLFLSNYNFFYCLMQIIFYRKNENAPVEIDKTVKYLYVYRNFNDCTTQECSQYDTNSTYFSYKCYQTRDYLRCFCFCYHTLLSSQKKKKQGIIESDRLRKIDSHC